MTENTLYRIGSEKAQHHQKKTTMGREENMISTVAILHYLKCPAFNTILKHAKKHGPDMGEKKQSMQTVPEEGDTNLIGQRL